MNVADEAATRVLADNGLEPIEGESPIQTLGWALGEQITYESGLVELVEHALQIEQERVNA